MNQRISVRAIIQKDEKILLLRRANGRPSIIGQYELPGGKVAYGEQPEDALRRYLYDDARLHVHSSQLFDAVTYIDHDDRDIQYVVIAYLVNMRNDGHSIELSRDYDKYSWQKIQNISQSEITDLSQLLLGIVQQDTLTERSVKEVMKTDADNTSNGIVTIYSDGGSRGNPGPSAAGYVIMNNEQVVIDQGGEYLGVTTNNQAEYQGVRLGLEKARALGYKRVAFCLDSMLVVNQMNGSYKIKNRELWPINERIRELMTHFTKVTFRHVPRELNQLADNMVNKTLDSRQDEE
jgi:ribonuclease HI/ADP-ribose pyrophosphatase YjhB (NUDIX family)